jgi:hypothetical protein
MVQGLESALKLHFAAGIKNMLGPLQNPSALADHQYSGGALCFRYHALISVPWGICFWLF